jgi:4-methylaminobutanoate oxidase (formaldehyde-forming)
VAVYDQSSFGKALIAGPDAEAVLQRVCSADMAVPNGRAVYTAMLNSRGCYEADVTVTRTAHDEYLLVTGAASIVRDIDWIRRHVRPTERVSVVDVTPMLAVFGVMGPRSRETLQQLTRTNLDSDTFPFSTSQRIDLGYATVRATRITYVGELGWELYVPVEFASRVYDQVFDAGAAFDARPAGYYTINSLRLEKGYRAFGTELTPDYTPVDAGLAFTCKLATDIDFIGRAAVEGAREAGPRRRLASLRLDDPDAMMWGGELVTRDGQSVGQVTSAAWGATVGSSVGLAYLWGPEGGSVTVEDLEAPGYAVNVGGRLHTATLSRRPLVDPDNRKVRS